MNRRMLESSRTRRHLVTAGMALLAASISAADIPEAYWSEQAAADILDKTLVIELAPELDALTDVERLALPHLLDAGRIMHELYLEQRHPDSLSASRILADLHAAGDNAARTSKLIDLFYLFKGPIATTLDNRRQPFAPVADETPGKALYPSNASREFIESLVAEQRGLRLALLGERTVVRAATPDIIAADLARLDEHPGVEALHPGLRDRLESLDGTPGELYAIPYALAYAAQLADARRALLAAAAILDEQSPDFAAYLTLRATDLLTGDYEAGDAAWVTGDFDDLNLQIGSYETYDDALFGVKAFYGASVLVRDAARSDALETVINDLQAMEDALPYTHQKTVRSSIPVGVYNIVADFGQARGANTATILPNDADHTRKYGRTILIRNNILSNPALFAVSKRRFAAIVAAEYRDDLTLDGGFDRTLWHEVGHYLGIDRTADGRSLADALRDRADLFEELKADLVSLYSARGLAERGYYDEDGLKAHYAAGILRTLLRAKPRPAQPYQNMQLMQFNYFIETGLVEPEFETGLLRIHYDRYHDTIGEFLNQVLHVQFEGDYAEADAFVTRWNYWEDKLHGRLAHVIDANSDYPYTMVRYRALDE